MSLHNDSVLDLAVDGAEFLSELLSLVHDTGELLLEGSDLVSTLGNNLSVVGRATTVPGEDLIKVVSKMNRSGNGNRFNLRWQCRTGRQKEHPR